MGSPTNPLNPASLSEQDRTDLAQVRNALPANDPRRAKIESALGLNTLLPGVKVAGTNAGGQPIYAPEGPPQPQGSALGRFGASMGHTILDAGKGLLQTFAPPQTPEESVAAGLYGPIGLAVHRAVIAPAVQQAQQAVQTAPQSKSLAAGHALAAALPMVGPWAAQTGEQVGTQVGQGDYAGAAGTVAGNAALAVAPKVVGKAAAIIPKVARRGADILAGVNTTPVKDLVADTQAANEAITNPETGTNAQAAADHAAEIQKVNDFNQRVVDKHRQISQRIAEGNQAADQTAGLRQQATQDLAQHTQNYYAAEDAAKAKAKATENAAWQPWRQKMQGVTIDGGEIAEPLKKLASISPEVERTLHQLEPRGDEVPSDSPYRKLQDSIAQNYGADNYDALSPDKQGAVDKVLASMGEEPPSIEFNPQTGKSIPVEQIHRANSILQRYISSGKFEGPLLGEMKQVAKVLRSSVTKASDASGALDDLNNARQETVKYQQAFGRDRHTPITQDEMREKTANPEAYKEREDQARLDAASRVDPTLVDAYQKVKTSRDALKSLPSEDQLRKGQKQLPPPPTVDDLRSGYRLKPLPEAPPETPTQTIDVPDIQKAKTAKMAKRSEQIANSGNYMANAIAGMGTATSMLSGHWGHVGLELGGRALYGMAKHGYAGLLDNPGLQKILSNPTPRDIATVPPGLRGPQLQSLIDAAKAKGIKVHPAIQALVGVAGQAAQGAQPAQ